LLLRVSRLTVDYVLSERAHRALDDLSFGVAPGEVVGILGESGAGKSTLALAILGLLPPNARVTGRSEIVLGERDVLRLAERELDALRGALASIIFQEPAMALNPVIRVGDQVAEVARAHRDWTWKRCREAARETLHAVRLADEYYAAYPHQLSGGQQQRVVIAAALICRPSLLIADEPTSALDSTMQGEVLGLIQQWSAMHNSAVLVITHDPTILSGFARRVIVMNRGRLVEEGPCAAVLGRPAHTFTRRLLAAIPPEPPGFVDRK
jgi:peptide/nickel transport system ATP-binding protein